MPTPSVQCNLCDAPGALDGATDVARIASNVRKFRHEEFTVWRCNHCRSLHAQDPVDLDHYYADYFIAQQKLDYFTRCGYRNRLRLLKKAGLRHTHRILDHGCGPGIFVKYLRDRGYPHACGYDAYASAYSDRAVLESRFDVITSFDVIEHDENPRHYLAALAARLGRDGLLVIATPNAARVTLTPRDAFWLHQPYHRHILSEAALVSMGGELGLETVHVHRRCFLDTLFPAVNTRFVWEYVLKNGNVQDVTVEPARVGSVIASPKLLFYMFYGYFFPPRQAMLVFLRKSGNS